ncbi:unnamed protein product [Triticum turgidum subsp. durum]|uniref:NAC domain-containing protein n=1 Tax=Triticum turgidum subsp. durum TaxID=4567 RepID=A0A9R0QQR9_TRITD|nr:unnamed protein product [Triticum turgidum subsp. durum]
MASPRTPDSPRGLIFAPGDADLITIYLQRKISGLPLPVAAAPYIDNADVYAAEPAAVVTGLLPASASNDGEGREWYLFTSVRAQSSRDTRRCRAVAGGVGTWHSEKARCDVLDAGGAVVGYRQPFTYEPKNGWLMLEFSQEDPRPGEAMPALCKIYKKRRAGRSASKPISSGSSSMSGSKRKAAAAGERSGEGSSARVRRCLQFRPSPAAPNPPTLVATSGIQEAFLLPVERPQAEQEPQEPPVRRAPTATPLIPSFSMGANPSLTFDGTAFLRRAQDSPTPANSDLSGTSTALLGNYELVSPASSELTCYNAMTPPSDNTGAWAFQPSALTSSNGTTSLLPGQDWATPESSQVSEASTVESYSCFSPDHATSRPTTLPISSGTGYCWSLPQYSELSAIFGA